MKAKYLIDQGRTLRHCCTHLSALLMLLCSALSVSAQSYEEGRSAYTNGDYVRAFEILEPLAEAGDAEAQKMLGIMYDYGHGVQADPETALKWYMRAARQGQAAVQYQVGARYFRGTGVEKDDAEAARWWEMAAAAGQVDAQFNLGLLYFRGLGLTQDDQKAADLFRQAARQGHSHAQYSLAVMYAFGRGLDQDRARALEWFEKSAAQGVAQAQFNLGVFYENGYGMEKDAAKARQWYERAAAQGLAEAQARLAQLQPVVGSSEELEEARAEQSLSSADYRVEDITPTGIKREDWVLKQPSDSYTLQIGSISNEQDLINFIKRNQIEADTAYIELMINGETRYNAFYGSYADYRAAKRAIDSLPPSLRQVAPWVRNFGVLKGLLEK